MQAVGNYEGGKMLFLDLGSGLGSALVVDGIVEPMELGHLPHKKRTYKNYIGLRGLERIGEKNGGTMPKTLQQVWPLLLNPRMLSRRR
jgi:hypothetical protein